MSLILVNEWLGFLWVGLIVAWKIGHRVLRFSGSSGPVGPFSPFILDVLVKKIGHDGVENYLPTDRCLKEGKMYWRKPSLSDARLSLLWRAEC